MLIKRTSCLTGKDHEMEIDVTLDQIAAWKNGQLIQHAMPNLTPGEREFLLTGATQEEWEELFREND